MTSACLRRMGAATWLTLATAAHPAWAAKRDAARLWDGAAAVLEGGGVIALFMPPIVLITFTAVNVLGLWQNPNMADKLRSLIDRRGHRPEKPADPPSSAPPAVTHGANPFLALFRQVEDRLAAIAGVIGTASGALAAISRGSALKQTPTSDRSAADDPGDAAAIRSESAFVLGAAQSLEASIGDAADAVSQLAEAIADVALSARSAADLSARAEHVAQVAAGTLTRLDDAAQRIAEIAAFIDKVASQTQQASAGAFTSVANIIGGAAEAQRSIEEASGLIAKLRDTIGAAPGGGGHPVVETEEVCPPTARDRRSVDGPRPIDRLSHKFG